MTWGHSASSSPIRVCSAIRRWRRPDPAGRRYRVFRCADRLLGCGRVFRPVGRWRSVGRRATMTEDGDAISEWTVQVTAIQEFVDSGAGR
ncbi:hypothetical protein ACFROC_01615 [Nocardia tengchongensis]|uniref:hypothetical protein n=1 Tax=Nocardia tengchongensis TaxID=2055889 RepID=UPI0036D1DEFF